MKKALLVLTMVFVSFSTYAANTVRIAVAAEPYPPFASKLPNGSWEGFEIDIINAVCKEAALNCEIKEIAWDGIIPALQSKKVDAIFASMTITDERSKKVLFTKPYYNTLPAIVGLSGQTFAMEKKALKGKIVGVQKSTIAAFYIKEKAGKFAKIRYYDTQDAVNSDLLSGRIDFMLADDVPALDFLSSHKDTLEYYGTVAYEESLGKGIGAAVRHEDTQLARALNTAIESVLKSDFYETISMKYFGKSLAP